MQNPETTTIAPVTEPLARLGELCKDQKSWTRKAILNIMACGRFSSDRTIAKYAKDIWAEKNVTCHEANHPRK